MPTRGAIYDAAVLVEIRTYRVRPGQQAALRAGMADAMPLLSAAGIDVVAYGPSLVDDEGEHAFLIRAFASVEERDRLEEAFYASPAWRDGPRSAVLDSIESHHTVVVELPDVAVEGLRTLGD